MDGHAVISGQVSVLVLQAQRCSRGEEEVAK